MSRKAKAKTTRSAARPGASVPPAWQQRVFRCGAALGLPIFILFGVEISLRLVGYGYSTDFFVPCKTGSPGRSAENPKFGWRFFPRDLARAPDPIRLARTKPAGTCRIFVFGESAALGDPEPAYGFSRILRELLEERCPATKFEVVNVAMTAINSHAIVPIARDCFPFQGDIWVLYMGNNEVVGPFGPGSVFGAKAPPLWLIRASLAAKRTRLGQMLEAVWQRASAHTRASRRWEGMKMMLNEQIRASDPVLRRAYDHFARNLGDILSTATRAGVKTIVCSVSSNLKDCPPFASLHKPGLSEERKIKWNRWFESGTKLESQKDFTQALAMYRQAAEIDDTYAALAFRTARCQMALGNAVAARQQFNRALDLDALRFRADAPVNDIIRGVCANRGAEGVRFFDSGAVLTNGCEMGIAGAERFWDHVHFNFAGNYRVASGLADQVISLLPEHLRPADGSNGRVLTEAECAERLAFTEWDQRLVLERMRRRMNEPPFAGQLEHEKLKERTAGLLVELDRKLDRDGLVRAVGVYRQALEWRSGDWLLHHRLAFLLEAAGDFSGAQEQWKRVTDLIPDYPEALFKLGDMSARASKLAEAEEYYQRVLRLRPNSFEARNGLGLVFMSANRLEEAVHQFERAIHIEPQFAPAHVNWGLLMSRRGMIADAEAHFREALRCAPESAGAHINLGNLLAAQRKHSEAIDHYFKAIKLQPKEATVRLGLADSLEASGRSPEALAQYQEAIRLNPGLAEAHFNLGVALAKRGDLKAATSCFQEATRLNPKDPQAPLNLGVALAQQNQLREAIVQFEAVLRLDPANAAAQQYLRTATAREQAKR
ncbi:MAG: tetratricopeptide repeat protein [Verrucomicrobiales bacterium]|nr:tetratricopeptide repeat protein [Verrucomicrobiales bacterium]